SQYLNLQQNWFSQIASQVQMVVECIAKPAAYMNNSGSIIHIIWESPPTDAQGDLIQGFYCNLGRNNSLGAEMWSLLHAMCVARHLHLDRVIF
ncbi:hypothetical protein L195_g051600, partial [Trifolium pratense]